MNYFSYVMNSEKNKEYDFIETFGLKKGLKHFVKKGYDAAFS
jgi:hypothetical protein